MDPIDLVVAAPVIVAAVAAIKEPVEHYGRNMSPFAPLLSIGFGLAGAGLGWIDGGLLAGFIAGLSASGLYAGAKASIVGPATRYYQDHHDQ